MLGSAVAQHVQTDFDHQVNFSQYKTYSSQEIKDRNPLWDSQIKNAVDAQLEATGRTQVDSGGDIAVVAIKTTRTQKTLQIFYTADSPPRSHCLPGRVFWLFYNARKT
jgi:hypothetical protein